jgi:hypothetical protein
MPMACAPATSRDLRIYLINEAGAAQQTLDAAEAEAGTIWANAGLRLEWTFPPVPLDVSDGRTVVVVVRRGLSRPVTVDGADSQAFSHPSLGRIRFGEDGRPGNLIEVSFPALGSLVMSGSYLQKPISELPNLAQTCLLGRGLGRVVAHEIGHWLMGRGHSRDGLMRPSLSGHALIESNEPRLPRTWTPRVPSCGWRCPYVVSSTLHIQVRESRTCAAARVAGSRELFVPTMGRALEYFDGQPCLHLHGQR